MGQDKVVIIGASAAGLFAAYLLAREGIPVELYDQREDLGPPSRTLIVTGRLGQVLGFTPHQAILNRVNRIELISANRRRTVELQQPDLVIERRKLIELLAEKATEEGAEIRLGFRFLGFEDRRDELILSLRGQAGGRLHSVKANVLIGADGALSDVAKAATKDLGETMAIVQAKVTLSKSGSVHRVKVWFDKKKTEFFYWLIPESESRAAIGLISRTRKEAEQNLSDFLRSQECEILEFQAAPVPLHNSFSQPSRRLSKSRILFVGDAGGQVKATTMGGVVVGLEGAKAAARAIMDRMPYRKTLRSLRAELALHSMMRAILSRFDDQDYDQLLELLDARTRSVLANHNRDELKRALVRLLITQPRLLLLAIRPLVSPHRR